MNSSGSYVDAGSDIVVIAPTHDSPAFGGIGAGLGYSTSNESSDALGWFMYDQLPTDFLVATGVIDFDAITEFERLVDCAAADAVQRIRAESDDHRIEFGYFIIRDATGPIALGPRQTSNLPNEINFGGSLSLAETGATRWSDVLGFVHNHTRDTSGSVGEVHTDRANRQPSSEDWNLFDQLRSRSPDFRLYIISPNDVARQYDANDRGRLSDDEINVPGG